MKKFRPMLILVIMSLLHIVSPLSVSASSPTDALVLTEQNSQTVFEVPRLAEGETAVQEITSPSGEQGEIQVTLVQEDEEQETPTIQPFLTKWHTRNNVKNGTYNVNVVWGITNAGFKINVSNKRITRAYDPWHFHLVGATGTLRLDSSVQATYNINFNMSIPWINGPSWTGFVRARIENGNLVTYAQ